MGEFDEFKAMTIKVCATVRRPGYADPQEYCKLVRCSPDDRSVALAFGEVCLLLERGLDAEGISFFCTLPTGD